MASCWDFRSGCRMLEMNEAKKRFTPLRQDNGDLEQLELGQKPDWFETKDGN